MRSAPISRDRVESVPAPPSHSELQQKQRPLSTGINLQDYHFFTPQPIRGARAYFFRDICHDWSDEEAKPLLDHTADAMAPGYSRLSIEDRVVDDVNARYWPAASVVLTMLVLTGIERTRRQW